MNTDTDRRSRGRGSRHARIALLALVVAYVFLPGLRSWIPVWLPFLALLALEAQLFLGGWLDARRGFVRRRAVDRRPQPHDVAELGGERWLEPESLEETDEEPDEEEEEPPPEEPEPRARPRFLEPLVVLALAGAVLFVASRPSGWDAVSPEDRERAERLFSVEASRIARRDVRVDCDTSGDYVGFVQDSDGAAIVGGDQAYLTPDVCDTLYQLAFKDRVRSFPRTGRAIAVLAHEAWHLRGVRDEGLANCYAFQSGVRLGTSLGLSESDARGMMREQLATNPGDPRYLVPAGCRDGGTHDLRPNVEGFP